MIWKVIETRSASKEVRRLPKIVKLLYSALLVDLVKEGPRPTGWDVLPLKGREELRVRLNREYRVIIKVVTPDIIVIKVAHRKEAYE